ncbi:MAG: PEGA domain-containing protein [Thermoanaerobaculia bacterium]
MNKRTRGTFLRLALAVAMMLPAAALTAQTSGGHGSGVSHGGSSHRGGGSSHRGHGSGYYGGRGGHYGGYGGGGYYGGYFGLGGYGWYGNPGYGYYGGSGYYGYPCYYGGGYTTVYPAAGATMGALDLDVSPEGAQIYVDGNLVGVADDFDGYPTYLWLEKGTYDVVIFAPGFQTIARQYSIYGGMVIDVEDSMVPGKETMPQDLASRSTVNRQERLRRDRENEEQVRTYGDEQSQRSSAPAAGAPQVAPGERVAPDRLDARGEPGSLKLGIEPGDASVYLDGRFLGTGRELARLRSGLIVDPGEHRIEVVRPGRQSQEKTFSVAAGEEVRLDIELALQ